MIQISKRLAALMTCSALALGSPAWASDSNPLALASVVAHWTLAHPQAQASPDEQRGWQQAVFWIGMTRLADRPGGAWARQAVLDMGQANLWQAGRHSAIADDQAIGSAYAWAASHGAGPAAVAPIRQVFDRILAAPPHGPLTFRPIPGAPYDAIECLRRWCWSDALFMGPPAWMAVSRVTDDAKYRDYALAEFWATVDVLYDPQEHLFFRDSRFFDRRDPAGRKIFWSRGNGWVLAGIADILEQLPQDDPRRPRIEILFKALAARIAGLQSPDGYWPASLLSPDGVPETSGTALFTYGLAWGVEHGLLDRPTYEAAARRGWQALTRALQPDGRLGWVQGVGDQPERPNASDSAPYGSGAFLLASVAMADLSMR